ncbi:MAG: SMP-30/gluconolactonase/LRE family protein [Pseudobacter sp.]|uniref:SMP-30/gluconolactonase/LRE family protein n=1 Tax=Pseudobacter sp. TaxID=2045420 RepID=UPI003F823C29
MKKFFVAVSLLGILSCSKKGGSPEDPGGNPNPNPDPGNNTELTITTITPNSADRVPVTITGTGFNTTPAQNTVHFSGLPGIVTAATATTLTVTLPDNLNAGDHDVRVGAKGKNVTKVKGFHLMGWVVSNFAGVGPTGTGQNDGAADVATFAQPVGMVTDNNGNFYVADQHRIRKVTPQGVVSTLAGSTAGFADLNGTNARFRFLMSLAIDNAGNLYVADNFNHAIRKIAPNGDVTTVAGKAQVAGSDDGVGEDARFTFPYGVAVDPTNRFLYVGDNGNDVIRKIELDTRRVTTVAGNGTRTRADGNGLLAGIPGPGNLAFDADGNLIITEKGAGMLRKMAANGDVTTIGGFNAQQDVNIMPTHIAFDQLKNMYVSFSGAREIRKYATDGSAAVFAGAWVGPDEEFGAANVVQFGSPAGIVLKTDGLGNRVIYVADTNKKRIKKISWN